MTTFSVAGRKWANLTPDKTCTRCEQAKPADKFDPNRNVCRQCRHSGARRERAIARQAEFRASNPDVVQERNRAYYVENAEQIKANYRANPHLRWATEYRRRVKRLGIPAGAVDEFTKADVTGLYGDACHYCGGAFEEIDHAVPVSKGGPHTLANVRPSCGSCNRRKGTKEAP